MWVHGTLTIVSRLYCCVIRSSEVTLCARNWHRGSKRLVHESEAGLWNSAVPFHSNCLLSLFIVNHSNCCKWICFIPSAVNFFLIWASILIILKMYSLHCRRTKLCWTYLPHRRSQGGKGPRPLWNFWKIQSFCALRGIFLNKIMLVPENQTFCPLQIFGLATPLIYPDGIAILWRLFMPLWCSRSQAKFLIWSGISCDRTSKISDFCKIYDLFLNVSCFASQSKGVNFGNEVFDVCCENKFFN